MGHGSSSFGSIGSDSGPSAMVGAGWPSYPEQLQASTPFTHVINAFLHSGAHSGGSLETLGSGGLAATVVGLCLLVTGRLRTVRRLLAPLAALGSMPLTAYSAHVVLILVIAGPGGGLHAMAAWLWMGLGLILACTVWALYRGRGPLETITARSARAMAAGTENITTAG